MDSISFTSEVHLFYAGLPMRRRTKLQHVYGMLIMPAEPYREDDVQAMLKQTIQQVAAKWQELEEAFAKPDRAS
jgi:hypothetical protein